MSAGARVPLGAELDLLERPPGLVFHALLAFVGLYTLQCASYPDWDLLGMFLAFMAWLTAGVVWGVWLTVYNVLHMRRRLAFVPRSRLRWSLAPLVAGLTLLLIACGLPLRFRFALSRSAFERAAAEVIASPDFIQGEAGEPQPTVRIGLYEVVRRESFQDGARFTVGRAGHSTWSGFLYAPGGGIRPASNESHVELDGPWYVWAANY